jgi:hypothetical protein
MIGPPLYWIPLLPEDAADATADDAAAGSRSMIGALAFRVNVEVVVFVCAQQAGPTNARKRIDVHDRDIFLLLSIVLGMSLGAALIEACSSRLYARVASLNRLARKPFSKH